jgi:hypothetical protein
MSREEKRVKSAFMTKRITYTGEQLRSHWAYEHADLQGDSIVAFVGPCQVGSDHMVDLADVKEGKTIFSEEMLHFVVEHFDDDLEKTILKQKLLVTILMEKLNNRLEHNVVHRLGDDLFEGNLKLTVSIATQSPVSTLIHLGINIRSDNTPVSTKGLKDYDLDPRELAEAVMNQYRAELRLLDVARSKVRGVP